MRRTTPFNLLFRFSLITLFLLQLACSNSQMEEKKVVFESLDDVTKEAWQKLSQKKIFFGHQSVGNNLVEGMQNKIKDIPASQLNIIKSKDPKVFSKEGFVHASIGKNNFPQSKIDEFKSLMDNGIGNNADIAFFKFCFDDISEETDISSLFEHYRKTMDELSSKYSKTKFAYLTVPLLKKDRKGFIDWIKGIFGKKSYFADEHNIARTKFNDMMREQYGASGRLFDVAMYESTKVDGSREKFKRGDQYFYTLSDEYTDDGGHLNETGQTKIGEQFLLFLLNMD